MEPTHGDPCPLKAHGQLMGRVDETRVYKIR